MYKRCRKILQNKKNMFKQNGGATSKRGGVSAQGIGSV